MRNATLKNCIIQYEDDEGKRITGWTDDVSEENLAAKLAYLREMHEGVTYSGIVSATIAIKILSVNSIFRFGICHGSWSSMIKSKSLSVFEFGILVPNSHRTAPPFWRGSSESFECDYRIGGIHGIIV